jgi:hypothetical protein
LVLTRNAASIVSDLAAPFAVPNPAELLFACGTLDVCGPTSGSADASGWSTEADLSVTAGRISAATSPCGGSCVTASAVPPTTVTRPGINHFRNVPVIVPPKRRRIRRRLAIAERPIQENRPIQLFIGNSSTVFATISGYG